MINKQQHLLACLAEECAEVIVEVNKGLRFGLGDHHPSDPSKNNAQRIAHEMQHVIAVYEMLVVDNGLPSNWSHVNRRIDKQERVTRFMAYAREEGKLSDE